MIIEKVIPVIDLCTPATFKSNRQHMSTSTTPRNSTQKLEETADVKSFKKPQPKNCVICAICEESSVGRNPTATTCGHVFCCVCIRRAIITNKQCPTCKKFITSVNCFPLFIWWWWSFALNLFIFHLYLRSPLNFLFSVLHFEFNYNFCIETIWIFFCRINRLDVNFIWVTFILNQCFDGVYLDSTNSVSLISSPLCIL